MKTIKIIATLALFALSSASNANVIWDWSFSGETGQFETDGSGGAGTYNLIDFSVTSSSVGGTIGSLLGGEYVDGQFSTHTPYSFNYDGASVTSWLHSGSNTFDWWTFDSVSSNISYFFGWDSGNVNDPAMGAWWTANDIGLHGASNVTVTATSVPEPATIALLGLGLFGIGFAKRKSRIQ